MAPSAPHHSSSCPTTPSSCCLLPITSLPTTPVQLPTQGAAPSFIFLPSPTSPFPHTFFPGKSPEAMHLQRFSILGTRRKLPSAPLRARPSTVPLRAGTREGWLSSVEDQHPFVHTIKPSRPVWGWAQLIRSRGCRETLPRAAAPHAGSWEHWNSCPGRAWSLPLWRRSKPTRVRSCHPFWVTLPWQVAVGLGDLHRSFPISTIL